MKRILILGGGFAAIATALRLERTLRRDEASVTLVSRENFTLFTPMLPEVASGGLETRHVVTPIRAQLRRTQFLLADVRAIDLSAREVEIEHALTGTRRRLGYDQLVIALGSVSSTFGLPGIEERALSLKSLEDADRLRNRAIAMLELADVAVDSAERKRLLTFAFVGGGYTGVEAAGELLDFFRSVVRLYPSIAPRDIEVYLIDGASRLLPDLPEAMGTYSRHALERGGVRVVLGELVAGLDDHGLHLKSGSTISAATVVWSAGVRPSPLVAALGLELERGAIRTAPDFSVPGHPGLWAVGDCASIPSPSGKAYPGTAQHAIREGPVLARNIVAVLRGRPTEPFRYTSLGTMASLGARRGVADLGGRFILTGFPAWFLWRSYYLSRLPGIDRRIRVAFDWTLGLIFPRDIAELRVFARTIPRPVEAANVAGSESTSAPDRL